MSRVRIGVCSGPADAALVRSVLSAHGVAVVVGAEHHASLLGALGSSFLSLDIWVDEEDREEAAALLHDLRERSERDDHDDHDDHNDRDGAADDADRDDDHQPGAGDASQDAPGDSLRLRIDRRRRTGVVLLLGCFVTFGTAHMFTRAWMRGLILAAVQIAGLKHVIATPYGPALGSIAIAGAILTDLIGALWRVRAAPRATLPTARVHGA